MEYKYHALVQRDVQDKLVEEYKKKQEEEAKDKI